jgi:hypothetical protein
LFERAHHRRITTVLQGLNADLLAGLRCYFGGGTAIVMRHGEYRESADIDFLVSDIGGYRELRELVKGDVGINALTRRPLTPLREVRADQYGIRTLIDVGGSAIKFDIIHEGRIALDTPGTEDHIWGVATLTTLDMATSKLLANADRWADTGLFSRDIIDLAMMALPAYVLQRAITKASGPYGTSIKDCLNKAIDHLRDNPHRLDECMTALRIDTTPKAVLWQHIRRLYQSD